MNSKCWLQFHSSEGQYEELATGRVPLTLYLHLSEEMHLIKDAAQRLRRFWIETFKEKKF